MPTDVIEIVEPVVAELNESCAAARSTAREMERAKGADLLFLFDVPDDKRLFKEDLKQLGIPLNVFNSKVGWIRQNGYAFLDTEKKTATGRKPTQLPVYTNKAGIKAFCEKDFRQAFIEPVHIDQNRKKYHLSDLLLPKHVLLSGDTTAHWVASQCTHSMMTTFLRFFPKLAEEYASSAIEVDFTSHHFRHTLNTLLDEGGLSDLLQTEWFGRTNPRDTKAYQHTSREKRALMLREEIKAGRVGGQLADQVSAMPIELQDAVLKARVNAVHDVGPGICVHNFIQTPCERHLQCSAECKDYAWVKGDEGRASELKRLYAVTIVARETAEQKANSTKPKKSADWVAHNDKKLKVISQQLKDNGIAPFDVHAFLAEENGND